jgi:hypothetical protein
MVRAGLLSRDNVLTPDDMPLDSWLTSGLNPAPLGAGAEYVRTLRLTTPRVEPGNWFLILRVDEFNSMFEGPAELNNVLARPLEINTPDLVPTRLGVPATSQTGETMALSWTIRNQGMGAATGNWSDQLFLSRDTIWTPDDVTMYPTGCGWSCGNSWTNAASLPPGAEYHQSVGVDVPEVETGDWFVLVAVDGVNQVYEGAAKWNNVLASPIRIAGTPAETPSVPDLTPIEFSSPVSGNAKQPIAVSWTVQNQGSTESPGHWYDQVFLSRDAVLTQDDVGLGTFGRVDWCWWCEQAPLAPGEAYVRSATLTLPSAVPGAWFLILRTDDGNQVSETGSEINNTVTRPIQIAAPDLEAQTLVAPTEAGVGQTVRVSWTVANIGEGAAVGYWDDEVYLSRDRFLTPDDVLVGRFARPAAIEPLDSYTSTADIALPRGPGGDWHLILRADAGAYLFEGTAELNNLLERPIRLTAADLTPELFAGPTDGVPGRPVTLSWTVANEGDWPARGGWRDRVYLSRDEVISPEDRPLGELWNSLDLAPGGRYTQTERFGVPYVATGDWFLLLQSDVDNAVFESGAETNNTVARNIRIGLPDLAPTASSDDACLSLCAPSLASAGGVVTVAWTVRNQGDAPTSSSWSDQIYLSRDATLSGDDVYLGTWPGPTLLGAGEQYSRTVAMDVPRVDLGDWFLVLATAWDGGLQEGTTSKANNLATSPIRLVAADLAATLASVPVRATPDQAIAITYSVENTGGGQTHRDWLDRFYLSRDNVWTSDDKNLGSWSSPGGLAAGQGYTRTVPVSVPRVDAGDWFVIFRADGENIVFEEPS